jgi:hypothetical protein
MGRIARIEDSPELLAIVEGLAPGEDMILTRNGEEVGRIAGPKHPSQAEIDAAVEALRTLRKGVTLGGLSLKELRDEGRP